MHKASHLLMTMLNAKAEMILSVSDQPVKNILLIYFNTV